MNYEVGIVKLEKFLKALVMISFFLLIISIFRTFPTNYSTTIGRANRGFHHIPADNLGWLTIEIVGEGLYPQMEILKNGDIIDVFGNSKAFTIEVSDKDVISLNASMYNKDIGVKISDISSNIRDIKKNRVFIVYGMTPLSVIRIYYT